MNPKRWKKPTIGEVADLAGVSKTTVSVYLAGNKSVCSHATAEKIDHAVAQLNYFPNPLTGGAYLRGRRTIGLLAADDLERGKKPRMVYNMRLVDGILDIANESDYSILMYPFGVYLRREYRTLLDGRVDAVLFYGAANHSIVRRLTKADMPVVCFGCPESRGEATGSAYLSEAGVSRLALDHLWQLGHRRIAHLAGPFEDCHRVEYDPHHGWIKRPERAELVSKARREAAKVFLEEHDAYNPAWLSGPHAWKHADVAPTLDSWWSLAIRPTAIYCANDYIAWEAIRWARSYDIAIPQELALVGVDNVDGPDRELFLTSVDIEVEAIGREAMMCVLSILDGSNAELSHRQIEPRALSVRESTVGRIASANRPGKPTYPRRNALPLGVD